VCERKSTRASVCERGRERDLMSPRGSPSDREREKVSA
jgi:hypothetical protein